MENRDHDILFLVDYGSQTDGGCWWIFTSDGCLYGFYATVMSMILGSILSLNSRYLFNAIVIFIGLDKVRLIKIKILLN